MFMIFSLFTAHADKQLGDQGAVRVYPFVFLRAD